MTPWFNVLFPAGMIVAPACFLALWCYWTGVRGLRRVSLATLAALLVFGASAWLSAPVSFYPFYWMWGLGGFWALLFGVCLPVLRRAFRALPDAPRGASLKPRRVELSAAAWIWPFLAWGVLAAVALGTAGSRPLPWLGPLVGLATLIAVRLALPRTVLEPEPLGGEDPNGLAQSYEAFRRRRVRTMYWLLVILALVVTGGGRLLPGHPGWTGGLAGAVLGVWGGVFGTWADAQRYLLRRQLSRAEPPA